MIVRINNVPVKTCLVVTVDVPTDTPPELLVALLKDKLEEKDFKVKDCEENDSWSLDVDVDKEALAKWELDFEKFDL